MNFQSVLPSKHNSADPTRVEDAAEPHALVSCWSETGVYGDKSCSELPRVVHCRNCAVFSAAGTGLLARPLPEGYRRQWAEYFAKERPSPKAVTASAILFRLGNEWLAVPTRILQEVSERRPVHSLPHRRHGVVLGLANVRGELLICVALTRLLGLPESPRPEGYHRLLVANWEGNRIGFPVDEVQGPHRFHARELQGPPGALTQQATAFAENMFLWRQKAVGLLNPESLFAVINRNLT